MAEQGQIFTWHNDLTLSGRISAAPAASHVSHGMSFYTFTIATKRSSGTEDFINVLATGQMLDERPLAVDDLCTVYGSLRSFNNRSGIGSRLIITAYASELAEWDGGETNDIVLNGRLCKPPVYRKTPLGREICDLIIASRRRYGRVDYLPCIAWGKNAEICSQLAPGSILELDGRVQSREYIKAMETGEVRKTAYEISISSVAVLPAGADIADEEDGETGERDNDGRIFTT